MLFHGDIVILCKDVQITETWGIDDQFIFTIPKGTIGKIISVIARTGTSDDYIVHFKTFYLPHPKIAGKDIAIWKAELSEDVLIAEFKDKTTNEF